MSFLLGDDYGSSSSDDEEGSEHEHELDAALPPSESKQSVGGAAPALLPSADSVLADVSASSASFLAPKNSQSAAAAIVEIDIFKENERAKALQVAARVAERQSRRNGSAPPTEVVRKRPRAAIDADEKVAPAKKEKKDAKERVKAQRTKGQAGIGSNFRSWKSETEMSMRQQFD